MQLLVPIRRFAFRLRRSILTPLGLLGLAGVLALHSLSGSSSESAGATSRPATGPAATQSASRPALLTPQQIPGVEDFARVSPGLWRGAQPTAEGFAELKRMGVKTIVNLRALHSDRDALKGLGLRYAHIKCEAWHPEDEDVLAFLKIVGNPANQPVFLHCQHGADRTGYMVAAYRMLEQDWPLDEAVKELNLFGFHPIWAEITHYLKHFNGAAMKQKLSDAKTPAVETVE